MLIRLLAYPAIAYLIVGAFFWFEQGRILFPAPTTFPKATPTDSGLPFEDLRIPVKAGNYLHAWWIPAAAPSEEVILVFHGNGYVLEEMVPYEVPSLCRIGANLLLIDYRGYGSSSPTNPNEATVDEDAEAALNYLLRQLRMPIGKVFLYGKSIGSGPAPATYLARNKQGLAGLILESPFSSIDDMAAASWYFHLYPVRLMLHTHFDNLSSIRSVRVPLLIISGTADRLTPTRMANSIFASAHQPKQIYLVPGATHENVLCAGGGSLTQVMQKFIQREQWKKN